MVEKDSLRANAKPQEQLLSLHDAKPETDRTYPETHLVGVIRVSDGAL